MLPLIRPKFFYCPDFNWESKIAIDWYIHNKNNPWGGWTSQIAIVGYVASIDIVWRGKKAFKETFPKEEK